VKKTLKVIEKKQTLRIGKLIVFDKQTSYRTKGKYNMKAHFTSQDEKFESILSIFFLYILNFSHF
jgi:hypothetical protein